MSHPDSLTGLSWELDCTLKCRSQIHASKILAAVTRGDNAEIQAYCRWLCHNFFSVTDKLGRNILHMAAACGKWRLIEWLIKKCHSEVDVKDAESGWTALHRSLFYGQLATARKLLMYGANLQIYDHEGLTPLEILIKDRPLYIEYDKNNPSEVYVWGSNTNYNLGLGNEQSRNHPELLDKFRRENINIKQVVMCKFHSIFLSTDGRVFTCGHGHGGRLGQNSEQTVLIPHLIKGLGTTICQEIAAGQDHLIILTEGNQVWTCGLNTYHQLGHVPPPERVLCPRPITLKLIKNQEFIGVCAARYHTVLFTNDAVFTFGLNAGQLGHPKGSRTQISPRQVSTLDHKDWKITHVVASDGATVCATNKGDVFVLHEYQCRKIASRQLEIRKLSVVGGHLDAQCEAASVKEGGGFELRIVILTRSGKIFLWRESYPVLRRCLFNIGRQLFVSDLQVTHSVISFITKDGEGFQGNLSFSKDNSLNSAEKGSSILCNTKSSMMVNSLHTLLNKDECDLIRIKRLHGIHRAVQITSDSKGRNFAVLQSHPKIGLTELPTLPPSEMQENFLHLLQTVHPEDIIHDVIIKVGSRYFHAHKYILASQSEYFRKLFISEEITNGILQTMSIDDVTSDTFEQILQFTYTDECDYLKEGKEIHKKNPLPCNSNNKDIAKNEIGISAYEVAQRKNKKRCKENKNKAIIENPLIDLQDASKKFGLVHLSKRLKSVKLVNGKIKVLEFPNVPKLRFNRKNLINLCDVKLLSADKKEFSCHRCVLVARSEYFHNMLGSSWIESSSLDRLSLSIESEILEIILDYLYTDNVSKIYDSDNLDLICNTLMTADLLLIDRLKAICELTLVDLITLKNAAELLEISFVYNAPQLKVACMEYICINLPAILENGYLNAVSDEAMEELTKFYQKLVPAMNKRIITPYSMGPTHEEMQFVAENFPVDSDDEFKRLQFDTNALKLEGKVRSRRRTYSHRSSTEEHTTKEKNETEDLHMEELQLAECLPDSNIKNEDLNKVIPVENSDFSGKNNSLSKLFGKTGWTVSSSEAVPMLKDIMMQEERAQNVTRKQMNIKIDSPCLSHPISKTKTDVTSPKNKVYVQKNSPTSTGSNIWKDSSIQKLPKNNIKEESSHNINVLSSFFPSLDESMNLAFDQNTSQGNPWNKKTKQEEKPVPNLDDILKAEERKLTLEKHHKAKPLRFIHLEDGAIEELLKLYEAEDNPEEKITVRRILPERVTTPVWKKNSFSSFSLSS
ncbi:inhibitor of Bruton tyrosine kinase [Centruroides vittatus]|uniref:inhibitor of Bruton tyrosine kinase n=1 Tax=Centruroides vittatus TaxID=120091 RepID=UPI00350FBC2C